jgi:predicted phosphodiesterase
VAEQACPNATVWVYGHSHRAENHWVDGRLVFYPGAAIGFRFGALNFPPSYGLLRIYPGGRVQGEIVKLHGLEMRGGEWVQVKG